MHKFFRGFNILQPISIEDLMKKRAEEEKAQLKVPNFSIVWVLIVNLARFPYQSSERSSSTGTSCCSCT